MDEVLIARKISLYYTILCALFVAMSPQFMGFILPLLFLLPIFMSLSGLKYRKKSGYLVAMGIVPLAIAISVMGIRYSIDSFSNMTAEISRMGTAYHLSSTVAEGLILATAVMSFAMIALSSVVFGKLYRYRKIFK